MKSSLIKKLIAYSAVLLALVQVGFTGCPEGKGTDDHAALNGDYGDAPDALPSNYSSSITASFPTRFSSDGAHHLDVTDSALGGFQPDGTLSVSAETDATDPLDPDGVQNIDEPIGTSNRDAKDDGLLTTLIALAVTNNISFLVSVAPTAPTMTRYVNFLADWNKDGEWKGTDVNGAEEWVVKNMPVDVPPGMTLPFISPDFLAGVDTDGMWVRLTLSDTKVEASSFPMGWDGTGEFAKGETEDYFLRDHVALVLPDKSGGGGGGPPPPPPPPWPPVGGGGGGGGGGGNGCEFWKSYNVTLCKGQSRRFLALVGGFAPDSVTGSSDDSSVASVEIDEANVTIKGEAEGETDINLTVTANGCVYHITVHVKVKKCDPAPKIECCTPAEIAKDPSRCKNCHVVGWKVYTNETPGGGGSTADGSISETGSYGDTSSSITKSTVVMVGNVVKIIVTYYHCDPCPEAKAVGDRDGDKIPDDQDLHPDTAYDPEHPGCYDEQFQVDSFFDISFPINNDHGIFDQRFFDNPKETIPTEMIQMELR